MQSTPPFLAALSERFSPGEVAQIVGRLLRMPAVWQAIRELKLDPVPASIRESPIHLFMAIVGQDVAAIASGEGNPEVLKRAAAAFHATMQGQATPSNPEDLALASIGLVRALAEDQVSIHSLAQRIREVPASWHDILTIAFPLIEDRRRLYSALLKAPGRESLCLAVDSHLANLEPSEAAAAFLGIDSLSPVALLSFLQDNGEAQLAQFYAEALIAEQAQGPGMERRLDTAAARSIIGSPEETAAELERIWEKATEFTGALADRLAGHGSQLGNPVIELEARMQALQARPTAERRAEAAVSLARAGRIAEAQDLVRHPGTPADWIAKGMTSALQGEREPARAAFLEAAQDFVEVFRWSRRWIARLEEGLWECDEISAAVELIRADLARRSSSPDRLGMAARRFLESGYEVEALDWAQTALTLAPQEPEIKQLLAECFCVSQQPRSALPYWQDLAASDPAHILSMSRCALDAGEDELARESIDAVLAEEPSNPEARLLLSRCHASHGDDQRAQAILDELIDDTPDFADAWMEKSAQILSEGDEEQARETLRRAVQIAPKEADLLHALADWDRSQGRLSEAREWIAQALDLNPKHPEFLRMEGEILLDIGHPEGALTALEAAHRLRPGDWQTRFRLAELLEGQDRLAEASNLLDSIPDYASKECFFAAGRIRVRTSNHPAEASRAIEALGAAKERGCTDPGLHLWLGRAYELEGSAAKAFEAYQSFMEEEDAAPGAREQAALGMSRTALSQGRSEAALSLLEPLVREFPKSVDLQLAISSAFEENGLLDEAFEAAKAAAELDPGSPSALQRLTQIACKVGHWEDALNAWDQLCASSGRDPQSWLVLTTIASDLNDERRLRKALAGAVWYGRRESEVLKLAGEACSSRGWLASAQRLLTMACKLDNGDSALLAKLAQVSARAGNLDVSESAWRQSTEIHPEEARYWVGYAETLWSRDQRSRAIGAWQRALALDPTPEVHVALARAHSASQELELALHHYGKAVALRADDAAFALEAGRTALQAGQAESAVTWLQQSAKAHPDRWEPFVGLGEALMALGRTAAATRSLQHAAGLPGAAVQVYSLLAKAHLASGRAAAARSAFNQAISKAVRSTLDRITVSDVALQLGEWDHALNVVQPRSKGQEDPRLEAQMIRVQVRLRAARWLFVDQAEAHQHGPSAESLSPESFETMEMGSQVGDMEAQQSRLLRLAFESASDLPIVAELRAALPENPEPEIVEALTIGLLRAGRPLEARELIQLAATGQWHGLLDGLALEALGQLDDALKAYDEAEEGSLVGPLALALGARLGAREGWALEALSRYQRAITLWPDEPAWQRALAEQHLAQNSFDAAIAHAQQAVELDLNDATALLLLARLQHKLGDLQAARSTYGSVIQLTPQQAEVWREAGEVAFHAGEPEQALAWYERAAALNPDDPIALAGAAQSNMALGQIDAASGFVRAALRLAPGDPDVLSTLASVLAHQGKHDRALEAVAEAVQTSDRRDDIVRAQIRLLLLVGRNGEAADEAERLVESSPDDENAWSCLALALEAEGAYEQAADAAAQAAALAPRSLECRLMLGRMLRKAGHLDRALDELTKARDFDPDDWRPLQELARVYEARRQPKVALELYARITEQKPDAREAFLRGGMLLKELKAYPEAARWLERVVELDPRSADAHHQLAAVRALELVHGGFGKLIGAR